MNNDDNNKPFEIDVFKDFLEVQKHKISLEASKLEVEKQHLQNEVELAKQSISVQEKILINLPKEQRKDKRLIFFFSVILLLIILGFAVFCLKNNYEKFLNYLIGIISHIVMIAIGYYFGSRKDQSKNDSNNIQDVETID